MRVKYGNLYIVVSQKVTNKYIGASISISSLLLLKDISNRNIFVF